jgi:hypothetical protein
MKWWVWGAGLAMILDGRMARYPIQYGVDGDPSDTSRYLPIPHPSHPVSLPQVSSPALVGGGKNPLFLLLPYGIVSTTTHNLKSYFWPVAVIEGFTGQPPTTTQPPKITKNSNLTAKTPQNEEKECIFVIYALSLATKYILRIF